MNLTFHRPRHPLRTWRAWLLLLALACTVWFYSIEATHDHRTAADDLRCPVCHVLGHNALDSATPELKPVLVSALLCFLLLPVFATVLPRRASFLTPLPRPAHPLIFDPRFDTGHLRPDMPARVHRVRP